MKTVSDMILEFCGKTDSLVTYSQTERHNTLDKRASSERAARELGHCETVSLDEGLRRTVAWQREYYGLGPDSRT
jgi:dTDP-glucose 4,6-dehydratase